MSNIVNGLLFGWNKNLDYGKRLVADLSETQMVAQPVADGTPANHAAWVFSHLNVYIPVIECLITGNEIEDPKEHRYGMQSKPEADRDFYPSKQEMLATFVEGHQRVEEALQRVGESALDLPMSLERWKVNMPTVGIALPYLMLVHENNHLGQLSAWRRVLGLPAV